MRENFSIPHFIGKYLFDKMYDGGESRYLLPCGNRKAPHRCGAFALPGRWSEGAVQLSVVLFLAANNGCTNGCTTADKHKDNQQSRVAGVAGLRNGVLRYGCCSRCRSGCCNRCRSGRCSRCRSGRCSRCRGGLVGVLVLQGGNRIFDSFRHGIHFCPAR